MRALAALLSALAFFPSVALAFPFGGQASTVVPCYNRAIFARLGAPRGGDYIWTPSTKTYMFGPPSFAGQWLLGLASAPYYCVVSISPVIVWAGTAIDMMGSSGGAAGSISSLLQGAPPTTAAPPQTQTPVTSSNPNAPTSIGHVVVSEVFANVDTPHGTAPVNQWIELYNGSTTTVDISAWKLENRSAQTSLPNSVSLASGQYAVLIFATSTQNVWTIPTNARTIVLSAPPSGGFATSGDVVRIKNSAGIAVDAVSWGSNTSAFSPSALSPSVGYSLVRGSLVQDTDKAGDWVSGTFPTPGH